MLSATDILLKETPIRPDFFTGDSQPDDSEAPELSDGDQHILCARCRRVITTSGHRIDVNGAHTHTFANPHGIIFEIGCFQNAAGCAYQGPLTDDFSWFNGFAWRITCCGTCATHLGWVFVADGGIHFHGLILDRLVEEMNGG